MRKRFSIQGGWGRGSWRMVVSRRWMVGNVRDMMRSMRRSMRRSMMSIMRSMRRSMMRIMGSRKMMIGIMRRRMGS